jgi:hypothetical protein
MLKVQKKGEGKDPWLIDGLSGGVDWLIGADLTGPNQAVPQMHMHKVCILMLIVKWSTQSIQFLCVKYRQFQSIKGDLKRYTCIPYMDADYTMPRCTAACLGSASSHAEASFQCFAPTGIRCKRQRDFKSQSQSGVDGAFACSPSVRPSSALIARLISA